MEDLISNRSARLITVYSPIGGAGKSMIAVNVALALTRPAETRILLVDGDLSFGTVAVDLNISFIPSLIGFVQEATWNLEEILNVIVHHESGLHVLPAPSDFDVDRPLINTEVLPQFVSTLSSTYDYIIVDLPSRLDRLTMSLFEMTDVILLVMTPSLASATRVGRFYKQIEDLHVHDKISVVFNRAVTDFEQAKISPRIADIERKLGQKAIAIIPNEERKVLSAANRGTGLAFTEPEQSPSKELLALAKALRSSSNHSQD